LHPGDVIVQAKDACLAVIPAIGLEALETSAGVMEDVRRRVQRQRRDWLNRRLLLGAVLIACDDEVVAKNRAELCHGKF
jgi:hypothetical protein